MKKSKAEKATSNSDGSMSLSGHLRELRNRILVVVILLLAAFTACLSFSPDFITFLTDMGAKYNYVFVYIAPQELLLVYLNTALVGALVICFPVVAYRSMPSAARASRNASARSSSGRCWRERCSS